MTKMVRKQIYIEQRQERALKQLSEAVGVSEAEIIRRAIEREALGERTHIGESDRSAWDKIIAFVEGQTGSPAARPYRWKRQDVYEPRENRLTKFKSTKVR